MEILQGPVAFGSNKFSTDRSVELDLAKGMLVVIMLIYHTASIVNNGHSNLLPIIESTSFLHYVFLLLTGFMCGWHYIGRLATDPVGTRRRIRMRALKTMLVFVFCNALLYFAGIGAWGKIQLVLPSLQEISAALFVGINGSLFSFEILFNLSLALVFLSFFIADKIGALNIAVLIVLIIISPVSNVIHGLAFAGIGMLLGYYSSNGALLPVWQAFKLGWWVFPIILAIELYYRIEVVMFIREYSMGYWRFIVYLSESLLWILSSVFLLMHAKLTFVNSIIEQMGRYTLISYILQMLFIRIGYLVLVKYLGSGYQYYLANLTIATGGVIAAIYTLNFLRARVKLIDSTYKLVFS